MVQKSRLTNLIPHLIKCQTPNPTECKSTDSKNIMSKQKIEAPDLSQRPPRSPRCRLGGYVILPRMLDKCRATIAGKNGEYNYDCQLDSHFFEFVGIEPAALKAEVEKGKGDGAILTWINDNAKHKRSAWEIEQWSIFREKRGPDSDPETYQFFGKQVGKLTKSREDIRTWMDLLDLDDHVSFGGKA
jgi:hypothetical protein